jgi:hypothetical protein
MAQAEFSNYRSDYLLNITIAGDPGTGKQKSSRLVWFFSEIDLVTQAISFLRKAIKLSTDNPCMRYNERHRFVALRIFQAFPLGFSVHLGIRAQEINMLDRLERIRRQDPDHKGHIDMIKLTIQHDNIQAWPTPSASHHTNQNCKAQFLRNQLKSLA